MKQIGNELGVNESRVSQIHKTALEKLGVAAAHSGLPLGARFSRGSEQLDRISHHLTAEARDRPAITSLHLLAVLNVGSSTCLCLNEGRQAARASS